MIYSNCSAAGWLVGFCSVVGIFVIYSLTPRSKVLAKRLDIDLFEQYTVQPGDSLWSLANQRLEGVSPTNPPMAINLVKNFEIVHNMVPAGHNGQHYLYSGQSLELLIHDQIPHLVALLDQEDPSAYGLANPTQGTLIEQVWGYQIYLSHLIGSLPDAPDLEHVTEAEEALLNFFREKQKIRTESGQEKTLSSQDYAEVISLTGGYRSCDRRVTKLDPTAEDKEYQQQIVAAFEQVGVEYDLVDAWCHPRYDQYSWARMYVLPGRILVGIPWGNPKTNELARPPLVMAPLETKSSAQEKVDQMIRFWWNRLEGQ